VLTQVNDILILLQIGLMKGGHGNPRCLTSYLIQCGLEMCCTGDFVIQLRQA
jgi:hypothetical protein